MQAAPVHNIHFPQEHSKMNDNDLIYSYDNGVNQIGDKKRTEQ